jgi:hypothetical protein
MMESHIARILDNVQFRSIDIYADLLLSLTCEKMKVPIEKQRFDLVAKSDQSCRQLESVFWFCYAYLFEEDSEKHQMDLMKVICDGYVHMMFQVDHEKDAFFDAYPYALGHAVVMAFQYFIPGSRNLYDAEFKHQVYVL